MSTLQHACIHRWGDGAADRVREAGYSTRRTLGEVVGVSLAVAETVTVGVTVEVPDTVPVTDTVRLPLDEPLGEELKGVIKGITDSSTAVGGATADDDWTPVEISLTSSTAGDDTPSPEGS